MKLIFKYKYKEYNFSKGYYTECVSFRRFNEIPKEIKDKAFFDLILNKNILNEVYLADYIDSSNLDLAGYIIEKLNDKDINNWDIGSQRWDVELEKDKVIIAQMCSSEDDKRAYINREETAYAMLKWKSFLERKFDDPDYQEIIDTEDVYR